MPEDLDLFNTQLQVLFQKRELVLAELKTIGATNPKAFPAVSNIGEDGIGLLVNYNVPQGLYPLIAVNTKLSELLGFYLQIFPKVVLKDEVLTRAKSQGVDLWLN